MFNPMQMLEQLLQNPLALLQKAGFNVPMNMIGNPQLIVQHLAQSGQVSQAQLNQAQQMAQMFGVK